MSVFMSLTMDTMTTRTSHLKLNLQLFMGRESSIRMVSYAKTDYAQSGILLLSGSI